MPRCTLQARLPGCLPRWLLTIGVQWHAGRHRQHVVLLGRDHLGGVIRGARAAQRFESSQSAQQNGTWSTVEHPACPATLSHLNSTSTLKRLGSSSGSLHSRGGRLIHDATVEEVQSPHDNRGQTPVQSQGTPAVSLSPNLGKCAAPPPPPPPPSPLTHTTTAHSRDIFKHAQHDVRHVVQLAALV